jgi:hypothetical protein
MFTKIAYNACYGGFGLSVRGETRYAEIKGIKVTDFHDRDIPRDDPALIQVIEELGSKEASSRFAELRIKEVRKGTKYRIDEYDGAESVMTIDDYEWQVA